MKKQKDYPTRYVLLRTFKKIPLFLFIEKNAPLKNGIEVIFQDNSLWTLAPIEKLKVFKGYKVTQNSSKKLNYLNYEQNLIFEKKEKSNYKPGLEKTVKYFLKKFV